MPLDCGNRGAAVSSKPFDLNSVAQPHAGKRVARAIGFRGLISTPRRIRYQTPARHVWKLSGLPSDLEIRNRCGGHALQYFAH